MRFEASEDSLKIVKLLFLFLENTTTRYRERMHRAETRRGVKDEISLMLREI